MKKEDIEPLLLSGLSTRAIAGQLDTSQTNIRYWIRKLGLRDVGRSGRIAQRRSNSGAYSCPCGVTDPLLFSRTKKRTCRSCHNRNTILLGQRRRALAIQLLGGKCRQCGYDRCLAALQVHHTDSSKKDPNFSGHRGWSKARLVLELAHCVLLCANCHREFHAGIVERPLWL